MEALNVLIAIGLIHCLLLFFDTIFKSCSHYPYLYFLKNTGLEIQVLRITWFTTAFNRKIIKWGMGRSKFWTAWFNAGVIVSVILLPLATIAILRMTFNIWTNGPSLDNSNSEPLLEPMLPGIDVPCNEIGYYIITLVICTFMHELGHALAAAREDVQLFGLGILIVFIIPTAYVHISSEQLTLLPIKNQLRVICAGVWHNIVLATAAATIVMLSTWLWTPFYAVGNGIYVKTILPNSPVLGPTGLLEQDVIYEINDCPVKRTEDWYNCILHTINQPALGFSFILFFIISKEDSLEYDESVPSRQKTNGVINCCTSDSEVGGSLCFEYIEGPQAAPLHLPPHSCLPARAMINQSQNFCHASHECLFHDTHCLKPSLDNITKAYEGKDVLFFGHPADIYRTVDVSDWIPKYSFLNPKLPETVTLLSKYITVFSAGLAVINIMPCFFLDGQYIINILMLYLLNFTPHNKNIRQTIILTITSISTLLLIINLLYVLMNKLL
ncbi:Membrane-bound transcription factor site-2 protease [Habropoda laboriosa]|uniref:Membrane-bound transcription factor site-2 protease n=1 Tax=Habropoda laboriosa TaxID=597456 RepID=A0A0L7RGF7_9HYME|nr:Membrane-bound transcription factor site-2 protease [Habropoda laboriosa]